MLIWQLGENEDGLREGGGYTDSENDHSTFVASERSSSEPFNGAITNKPRGMVC